MPPPPPSKPLPGPRPWGALPPVGLPPPCWVEAAGGPFFCEVLVKVIRPGQAMRLFYISWVLFKHGLDEVILATHLFRAIHFLRYIMW